MEIDKYTTTIAALAVGLQEGLPYSFTFDPTGYKAPFKVIAKATDGASDEVETEQLLPTPKVTEIDKDAYVKDTFDAFGVTGIAIEGNIDRDWLTPDRQGPFGNRATRLRTKSRRPSDLSDEIERRI